MKTRWIPFTVLLFVLSVLSTNAQVELKLWLNYADQFKSESPTGFSMPVHIKYLPQVLKGDINTWEKDTVFVFDRSQFLGVDTPEVEVMVVAPVFNTGQSAHNRYEISWETCNGTKTHIYELNNFWEIGTGDLLETNSPAILTYCKTSVVPYSKCDLRFKATPGLFNPTQITFEIPNPSILTDSCFGPVPTYTWQINGSAGISTLSTLEHNFTQSGKYLVCLTVVGTTGNTRQFCDSIDIRPVGSACAIANYPVTISSVRGYKEVNPGMSASRNFAVCEGPANYSYTWRASTYSEQTGTGRYFSFNHGLNPYLELTIERDSLCKTKRYFQVDTSSTPPNYLGLFDGNYDPAVSISRNFNFTNDSLLYNNAPNGIFFPGQDSTNVEIFDFAHQLDKPGVYTHSVSDVSLTGFQAAEVPVKGFDRFFTRVTPQGHISRLFMPTYFPRNVLWEESQVANTIQAYSFFFLQYIYQGNPNPKIGTVSGYIYDMDKYVRSPQPFGGYGEVKFEAENARILILDSLKRNIAWGYVNPNGTFFIDSLPTGNYILYVDHPHIAAAKTAIQISTANPDVNVQFRVGNTEVVPIVTTEVAQKIGEERLLIVPNPGSERIRLSGIKDIKEVRVFDLIGKMHLRNAEAELDVQSLQSGVYTIQATDGKGHLKYARFIKL